MSPTKDPTHSLAERISPTGGLSIAPSMQTPLEPPGSERSFYLADSRTLVISALAICIGMMAAFVAQALMALIGFFTNLSFYGRFSTALSSPANHHLGPWCILLPVAGGLVVGVMARFGSSAIRGHGIPEAMEQVLLNESRISPRVTLLKPLSAAISIGTGGPFGAEGPIIATGGALGSLIGQLIRTTASERKTLLAAGAAAGMTATFGSPVSAVLLAIELLLFEFRARSIIPVALACCAAAAVRAYLVGTQAVFPMPGIGPCSPGSIALYAFIGAAVGCASIYVTRLVYWIEDTFEKVPVHWMWWPAIGGVAVGVVGFFFPHTFGVGYDNIDNILSGNLTGAAMILFCTMKLVSWSISLGSGTSGGTLAPLFTIGGGIGAAIGLFLHSGLSLSQVDPRVAALVGMAAMFAGASRAFLMSLVFAFETTHQTNALLALLAASAGAYLVSALLMKNTIMTEKIVRRGTYVPAEYLAETPDLRLT